MRPADPRYPHESPRERHARLAAERTAASTTAQRVAVPASGSTADGVLVVDEDALKAVRKTKTQRKAKAKR